MNALKLSVVVPTYRRPEDLKGCLKSLFDQSKLPQEILVVDNDPDGSADPVIRSLLGTATARGVNLRYVRGRMNSLPSARNLGIERTQGDILFFVDDDVVLDRLYLEEIEKTYQADSTVVGVQGFMDLPGGGFFREWVQRLFYWFHLEQGRCRVLPSVSATYPRDLQTTIPCQWMSGANHSYRRSFLADLRYDEKLLKYADGEDFDMSYRMFKAWPGGLWINPRARCVHKGSMESRALGRELICMQEVYGLYLFWKLFEPSWKNKIIFAWSRCGRFLFGVAKCVRRFFSAQTRNDLAILLGAYGMCLSHWNQIRNGDLNFFNETLRGGNNVPKNI
jgi:GT2 family glycosyltransferase